MLKTKKPITVAIDSQISAKVSGGTETALLSLLQSLGSSKTHDRFLLLGLRGHDSGLNPYMGQNMAKIVWPGTYRWYTPGRVNSYDLPRRWQQLRTMLGPLGFVVPFFFRYYAYDTALTQKAQKLSKNLGPMKFLVPPAYRLYRGLRDEASRPMGAARADRILRSNNVTVVHFPYPLHFETSLPFVYEPWGLPHLHQAEFFQPAEREWMDQLFRRGCDQSAVIVTATNWVKNDIVRSYGINPRKICVIPRLPQMHPEQLKEKSTFDFQQLPNQFALFPAVTWPTKNHIRLLRAIAILRDSFNHRLHLVCTGRHDPKHWPLVEGELLKLGLSDQVKFVGSIPFVDLQQMYRRAWFVVSPSLFEGLGLPLVEAFQYGVPVIASNATCIPEVVGGAALSFDPYDEENIAEVLFQAVSSPELLNNLKVKGQKRLNEFPNPEKMAKMFETSYRYAARVALDEEQTALLNEMLGVI